MFDLNIRNGSDGDDDQGDDRPNWIRRKLGAWWSTFRRVWRRWWPLMLSGAFVFVYVMSMATGNHTPSKLEKLAWLGLPSGAVLCSPIFALYLYWFYNPIKYWYIKDRGDDSDSPLEVVVMNEAAHAQTTSNRHKPEQEKGTLNPTFRVMDIDTEAYTVEPGYRGRMDADDLRRDRQNFGVLWDRVQKDGLLADMYRNWFAPILRELDYQRAKRRNDVLEGATMPGSQTDTVDNVIRETVPDEFVPPTMQAADGEDVDENMVYDALEKMGVDEEDVEDLPERAEAMLND